MQARWEWAGGAEAGGVDADQVEEGMAGDEAGWVQWSHNRGLQSASQTFRNRDLPRIFTWSGPWGKGSGCSMAGRREWGGTVCSNMVFLGSITQTSKQAFNGGLNENMDLLLLAAEIFPMVSLLTQTS